MNETDMALVKIILYFLLPLWALAGYVDWYCHKRSKIEETSGLGESLLHSLMGIQVGIPIFLCLIFKVNALILFICILGLLLHEIVAHHDVKTAAPQRHISILEVHAHNYLATTPLFTLLMVIAINWRLVGQLVQLDFSSGDQFSFVRSSFVPGGESYLPLYSLLLLVACVLPYIEELIRCLRFRSRKEGAA